MAPAQNILIFAALVALGLEGHLSFAAPSVVQWRAMAHYKNDCDLDGRGKACYDYGRAMWARGNVGDRSVARKYLLRGCELKYQLACDTYQAHSSTTKVRSLHRHRNPASENASGPCFTARDLEHAKFFANTSPKGAPHGQLISEIKPGSFWEQIGLKESDIVVHVNNTPFNNHEDAIKVFSGPGHKFSFEIERNHDTMILWYTCN